MNSKKKLLCVSIALAISPVAVTFAEKNNNHIEVDETELGHNLYTDDWMSIEIGTTKEVKKNDDNKLNFDHNSPIAKGRNSIAIGTSAVAGANMTDPKAGEAIAIGAKSEATKEQSIAIGGDTKATGWGAIVIGGDDLTPLHGHQYGKYTISNEYKSSEAKGNGSIVIGSRSTAENDLSVTIGSISSTKGVGAVAVGATSESDGNMSVAIGYNTESKGEHSVSLGSYAKATDVNTVSVGLNSEVTQKSGVALGQDAKVLYSPQNISIGSGSVDKKANQVNSATIMTASGEPVVYSGFSGTNPIAVLSVGNVGHERQIVNVAAGDISSKSTDAINGSQLYSIANTLKNDLDTFNPIWLLKDENGGEARINGGKGQLGNNVTVKGVGDISVTVEDDGSMVIDGAKIAENIKEGAIKIKDNDGGVLKRKLSEEIEMSGVGPIKTQVVGDKLEITADTASFTSNGNGGNGKITVNNGDDDKLVTAKKIADAINQSGWKIKADSENGGKVEGDNKEEL
ncbi:hemagglutinin, partial [Escherichia coli]